MTTEAAAKDVAPKLDDATMRDLRNRVGLFSETDLAQVLGVSLHTLQLWRINGEGPRYSKLGRGVMYRIADVQDWVAGNLRFKTTEDEAA